MYSNTAHALLSPLSLVHPFSVVLFTLVHNTQTPVVSQQAAGAPTNKLTKVPYV